MKRSSKPELRSKFDAPLIDVTTVGKVSLLFWFFLVVPLFTKAEEKPEFNEHEPHHISILFAGTDLVDEDETEFTLGVDYEYRINRLLGLGFVVEHAFGEIDATTLLAVADLHIWKEMAIQVGPGIEYVDGEVEAVGRIGLLYEFKFDHGLTFSPQIHYDASEEDALVFGFAFGKGF